MRLVTFAVKTIPSLHLVGVELPEEKQVVNLSAFFGRYESFSMSDFLGMGDEGLRRAEEVVKSGKHRISISDVIRKAPVTDPTKLICIGLNYIDHCKELGKDIPKEPVVFNKFPECVSADGDHIPLYNTERLDYEVELVAVIGKKCFQVTKEKASAYIAGYTVGHDVSARDWQMNGNGGQWLLGKTMKGYAPIGPAIVTDIKDPHVLGIRSVLNGKVVQQSSTKQLVFNAHELVAHCSQFMPLNPGDLIFTGTPPGVGMGKKPPSWLKDGDVITCEIDGIGSITNKVVKAS